MATGKKKAPAKRSTTTKSAAAKKGNTRSNTNTSNTRSGELAFESEVTLWVLLAVSVLLFISNLGIGGKVGDMASSFLFGLFGVMAYIFPIILFVGSCFIISNRNNHFAIFKFVSCILLFAALCMFLQLLSQDKSVKGFEIIKNAYIYSATFKRGGGAVGGIFVWICLPNFGTFGAFVIDIVLMIIAIVLITERSIFLGMKRGGQRMYESAKQDAIRYHDNQMRRQMEREEREVEREERRLEREAERTRLREARRMEKRVEGVALDITLREPQPQGGDALNEIRAEKVIPFVQPEMAAPPVEEIVAEPVTSVVAEEIAAIPETVVDNTMTINEAVFSVPEPVVEQIFATSEPAEPVTEQIFAAPEITEPVIETQDIFAEVRSKENEIPEYDDAALLEGLLADVGEITAELENVPVSEETNSVDDIFAQVEEAVSINIVENVLEEPCVNLVEAAEDTLTDTPIQSEETFSSQERISSEVQPQKAARNTPEENEEIAQQMNEAVEQVQIKEYVYPSVDLLKPSSNKTMGDSKVHLLETANKLQQTLKNFGVNVTITNVSSGPSVTRYEIQPEMGVKVSKIVNLTDDIKLNLAAADIRMEAPIPGKAAIGIEIPNKETVPVMFRDLVESEEFQNHKSKIAFAAGKDIAGQVVVSDIAKMPHVLIAGATGSGKSVCINTIIMSILYKAHPDDVKLIMVDPKVVELSVYNGIPHLMIPVVTDPKKAAGALNWAVAEMDDRYKKFGEYGVRNLEGYNAKVDAISDIEDENKPKKMPQIVIIVDELADLMMVASNEVETAICRLAQLARAAGIHLIIATQRPSVNVITGLIKANMPSRIAFSVTSGIDSRTILDMVGAEKLLGKGDMLFFPQNFQKPQRVQGAFVSDEEVSAVVDFIKEENGAANYSVKIQQSVEQSQNLSMSITDGNANGGDERDVLFAEAGRFLIDNDKGSIGSIQRRFKVGFNRAARIMDQLTEAGLVGPEEGTKPRKILMSPEEFEQYIEEYV